MSWNVVHIPKQETEKQQARIAFHFDHDCMNAWKTAEITPLNAVSRKVGMCGEETLSGLSLNTDSGVFRSVLSLCDSVCMGHLLSTRIIDTRFSTACLLWACLYYAPEARGGGGGGGMCMELDVEDEGLAAPCAGIDGGGIGCCCI